MVDQSDADAELIAAAKAARNNAYAKYSGFAVGAAVRATDGSIFVGVNVENASFGATVCAERNALWSAISAGKKAFSDLAIIADTEKPIRPCGICRQVIAEFGADIRIIAANLKGDFDVHSIADYFPFSFEASDLKQPPST